MNFQLFGKKQAPTLLLIPGLGVSYEIFLPLIRLLEDRFRIIAVEVDGFTLGKHTRFTSVDDQAAQVIAYIKAHFDGHLDCAYGLSLGGKILSRILERNELTIDHAILDAAPLLLLPRWLVNPLRYYQAANVWTCYHWTGFWKAVFRSHYFDVLLDECKKVWPFGGTQAVVDGYKSVYTNRLNTIHGADIHFWYGTKEAFVAKPQVKHLLSLCPQAHVEIFEGMNHGQLLIDHPEEIAQRITKLLIQTPINKETAYGNNDFCASDQLTPAERELVTVAALSAMDGVTPQFEGHKECAVFMGNTPEQVTELCRWLEKHIK